ncbi:aquaporin [Glaesserella parasuis]|uniref:MIP/aquaporin family protein n=2 Tax=Glaesserella parasuis TaxID=738 RepID=UPI00243666DA|nr:aquaporin [Glaesserella parasuis]MDG6352884.1 aquaporin [Glaesserella parasuis]MDG6354731.1 aquaporin [Glaesserella parasuis]MDG6793452.1 aquaporin [Glaesserella parasuis]MDG6854210.1 aquaporin [Glaesserella parasuis]MDO9948984.1 MIP/aquaporin family protein [Glaesserella parasuis]
MDKSLKAACIGEFIGTGLIIFFGAGCVAAAQVAGATFGLWEISIVWGLAVAMAVYASAGLSGAHLNPAVTIVLWKFACFDGKKILPYIISQMLGAFCAAALVYFLYKDLFAASEAAQNIVRGEGVGFAGVFSTYPNPHISVLQAFFVEVVITAVLMALIFALTDDGNGLPRGAMGPLTGFAMNPARDFGPKLFAFLAGWGDIALTGGRDIPYFLVPIFGPIVGALLGGFIYTRVIGKNLPCNLK